MTHPISPPSVPPMSFPDGLHRASNFLAMGINPSEITIAETLKSQGCATACIGKWHLGDQDVFLPTRHGFGFYYGIPYSNDMRADPGELTNVVAEHPDIVRRLNELADRARKDIGDYQVKGAGARPTIRVVEPKPLYLPESALLPFPEPPSGRPERVSAVFPGKRPQRRE